MKYAHKSTEMTELTQQKQDIDRQDNAAAAPEHTDVKAVPEKSVYNHLALAALILSIAAWAALLVPSLYSGYVALGVAAVSVLLAAFGLKSRRRCWRDTATTAIIIGGVLIVVIISFIVVIFVGLKSL